MKGDQEPASNGVPVHNDGSVRQKPAVTAQAGQTACDER